MTKRHAQEFRWVFPPTGGVGEEGSHDAGLEHFKGSPLESLTREILQNSLDAAAGDGPVTVKFEVLQMRSGDVPDVDGLRRALGACLELAERGSERALFEAAAEAAGAETVTVLKISDFGTAGVGGPYEERRTGWYDLVKAIGSSHKDQTAGGSFGIGKSAPFTVSRLRTVWYTTVTEKYGFASQGVARLMAHPGPDGKMRRGFGAWGAGDELAPATDQNLVPKEFRRSEKGTDVIVLGFSGEPGWEEAVLREAVRSFHPAISDGKLAVEAGQRRLDRQTIQTEVADILKAEPSWNGGPFYRAWASPDRRFEPAKIEISGRPLGKVELRVVKGDALPRKIQRARSGGLVVDEFSPSIYVPAPYAGVLMASGGELCGFLKQLEPPAHNKWELKRAEDQRAARQVLGHVRSYIEQCLQELADEIRSEQVELDEFAGVLPGEDQGAGKGAQPEGSGSGGGWVELLTRPSRRAAREPKAGTPGQVSTEEPGEASAAAGGGSWPEGTGPSESSGGGSDRQPARPGGSRRGQTPEPDGAAGLRPATAEARAFLADPKRRAYEIILRPERTADSAYVAVRVADEEGGKTDGREVSSLCPSGGSPLSARQFGKLRAFGPVRLEAGKPARFEAVLGASAPDRPALSVEVLVPHSGAGEREAEAS